MTFLGANAFKSTRPTGSGDLERCRTGREIPGFALVCTASHTILYQEGHTIGARGSAKNGRNAFDFVFGSLQCYDHEFGGIARRTVFSRRLEDANRRILNKLKTIAAPATKENTDMAVKVGINGFGRIGRNVLRAALGNPEIDFVAVNDLTSPATLAHLLKYDSILGNLKNEVTAGADFITVDGKKIKVFSERDPAKLDWASVGAQIVVESTGFFTDAEKAKAHLGATVKKVIISAPAKNEDLTIVLGVNDSKYEAAKHNILSNASCTTNCLAPVVKVILETCGIVSGIMTTIHSYTNDQVILDTPHKDLRRARAAALSMIPTSTGAAKALKLVIPESSGKLDGFAIRVPTPNVSIVDLTFIAEKPITAEALNAAFKKASEGELKGILGYDENLLVSSDFKGNPLSSIVDAPLTKVVGQSVKVLSWYDNEWGYSSRVVDLIGFLVAKGL
jgi:glyceraldehyde 3-phosphate dehydrogenase